MGESPGGCAVRRWTDPGGGRPTRAGSRPAGAQGAAEGGPAGSAVSRNRASAPQRFGSRRLYQPRKNCRRPAGRQCCEPPQQGRRAGRRCCEPVAAWPPQRGRQLAGRWDRGGRYGHGRTKAGSRVTVGPKAGIAERCWRTRTSGLPSRPGRGKDFLSGRAALGLAPCRPADSGAPPACALGHNIWAQRAGRRAKGGRTAPRRGPDRGRLFAPCA